MGPKWKQAESYCEKYSDSGILLGQIQADDHAEDREEPSAPEEEPLAHRRSKASVMIHYPCKDSQVPGTRNTSVVRGNGHSCDLAAVRFLAFGGIESAEVDAFFVDFDEREGARFALLATIFWNVQSGHCGAFQLKTYTMYTLKTMKCSRTAKGRYSQQANSAGLMKMGTEGLEPPTSWV